MGNCFLGWIHDPKPGHTERHMSKLDSDLRKMIDTLCQKGDRFAQIDQFDDALDEYESAWSLLPEPKHQWPAATWILMAAGDVYFEKRDYVAAADALREAVDCPEGDTNPFILLRLGQSLFESGELTYAAEAFEAAYKLAGEELFLDEDPKYLQYVQTELGIGQIRAGGSSGRFRKRL